VPNVDFLIYVPDSCSELRVLLINKRRYIFVLPIAVTGCCIGFLCWAYVTDSDTTRLFEFGIWAGIGTVLSGLLVAAGASDNPFEFGERYNATKDAQEKQERIQGAVPIVVATMLAGTLIIVISFAIKTIFLLLTRLTG
jgi:hypothetical protein